MEKLSFKKRNLELEFNDSSHSISFPNVGQVNQFLKDSKDKEDTIEITIDFLETLGLPKSVSFELEPQQLNEVVSVLCGSKKI